MSVDDEDISQFLDNLTEREKQVLYDRFGLDLDRGTNEEILTAIVELTQEKIRKIESRALKKLADRGDDPNNAA